MATSDLVAQLAGDMQDAYAAVQTKGGTLPQNKNSNNLATAIGTIPTGITPTGTVQITQNGTVDVTQYASADVQVPTTQTWTATNNFYGTISSLLSSLPARADETLTILRYREPISTLTDFCMVNLYIYKTNQSGYTNAFIRYRTSPTKVELYTGNIGTYNVQINKNAVFDIITIPLGVSAA